MNTEPFTHVHEEQPLCALCGKERQKEISHIVPKFVIRKIKTERDSMRMRNAGNPNVIAQDGPKCMMLCPACEDRFSEWEKYFAETIYHPFYNKKWKCCRVVKDEKIVKFLASLTFRTIVHTFQNQGFSPQLERKYSYALKVLSDYLLEQRKTLLPMFFDLYAVEDYRNTDIRKACTPLYYYIKTGIEYTFLITPDNIYKFVTKFGPFLAVFTIENPYGMDVTRSSVYDAGLMCLCMPLKALPKDIKDYIFGGLKILNNSRKGVSSHQMELIKKRWSEYTGEK